MPGWPAEHSISGRTRRFAKWSAICSFALGMAGQVAYHLLAQAGAARAPWPVTMIVSCLPVLVLAMGTTLAHMLRADVAGHEPDTGATGPAALRSPARSPDQSGGDQVEPGQARSSDRGSSPLDRRPSLREPAVHVQAMAPEPWETGPQTDQARLIAHRLAAAGRPVSRRALRSAGVKGSNESLSGLVRRLDAELANEKTGPIPTS